MRLYINGQDIKQLVLGDVDNGTVVVKDCSPDEYLAELSGFLEGKGIAPVDVLQIYAVVGPGSPTSLR